MNFLPFVLIFFLVFGAISASFMSDGIIYRAESSSYIGRVRSLRISYNEGQENIYDRLFEGREKDQRAHSKTQKELEPSEKEYFRTTRVGSSHGAIYLATLGKGKEDKWLERVAIDYLKRIYGGSRFAEEFKDRKWVEEIFSLILKQQKKAYRERGKFLPLNKLSMPNDLKQPYHQLLRGTGTFDPKLERGYLPLDRSITFEGSERKPINIHYANSLLLETLFGKSVFSRIRAEEWPKGGPREKAKSQKGYSLNCKQLKDLLGYRFEQAYSHIHDNYEEDKKSKRVSDPKTLVSSEIESE